MDFLGRIALALTRWSERWVPSSFVIAILLTFLVFVLAIALTSATALQCVTFWGDGFWELLSFAMQMTLIMVSGYVVAASPPVDRALTRLARLPRGPRSCVMLMAFLSMALGMLHWGLSIVVSALMVRRFARHEPRVDYRLLVTAGYLGMGLTWHAGLSASAPLLVATPGHFLERQMGIVPLGQTIFSPFNLILAFIVLGVFTLLILSFTRVPDERSPSTQRSSWRRRHETETPSPATSPRARLGPPPPVRPGPRPPASPPGSTTGPPSAGSWARPGSCGSSSTSMATDGRQ